MVSNRGVGYMLVTHQWRELVSVKGCTSPQTLAHPLCQVLEDVVEYIPTPQGKITNRLDQILLNGNNIALLVPGRSPDDSHN